MAKTTSPTKYLTLLSIKNGRSKNQIEPTEDLLPTSSRLGSSMVLAITQQWSKAL